MKIVSEKYRFEKVVTGTVEFEIPEGKNTYLSGRSGGSDYVAVIIPEHWDIWDTDYENVIGKRFGGFTIISSTSDKEVRIMISAYKLSDFGELSVEIKRVPHGEDILGWITGTGEEYTRRLITEDVFIEALRKWRKIN